MKFWAFILALLTSVACISGPAPCLLAQAWPEHAVTLVTSAPQTLPWSGEPTAQYKIFKALEPRLSRELGVPVTLLVKPEGHGVLAANMVASAKPDGYLIGALGPDSTITRVIQGYTPYIWGEFVPVATAWQEIYALVTLKENRAYDLAGLAPMDKQTVRLACATNSIDAGTLLALEAARAVGFSWNLEKVDLLDPHVLLEGRADAIVMPLWNFKVHPQAHKLKVVTVFVNDDNVPCADGLPTSKSQGLNISPPPLMAFYLPNQVNWLVRSQLSAAITNALRQPAVQQSLEAACLKPYLEDLEGVAPVMNLEYKRREDVLKLFLLMEP